MKTRLDCFPCFIRQGLDSIRMISDDPAVHAKLLREVCAHLGRLDLDEPPPAVAQAIHRMIRRLTGQDDPYGPMKRRFNDYAMQMLPALKRRVAEAPNRFEMAVRLAIAGNSIDFGLNAGLTEAQLDQAIEAALREEVNGSVAALCQAVTEARDLLYLGDNTGEIVFDRLLIEQMPMDKVTFVVRGRPVLNDATYEDAQAVGLVDLVPVIDNGSDAPGTILEDCSPAFRKRFEAADVVVAKGQGNYETLNTVDRPRLFFLFKAKCAVIAEHLDCRENAIIVRST